MTQSPICYYNQNLTAPDRTTANLKLLLNLISVAMYSTNVNGTILGNKHISFLKFRKIMNNCYSIKANVSTFTMDKETMNQVTDLNSGNILLLARNIVLHLFQNNTQVMNNLATEQLISAIKIRRNELKTDITNRQSIQSDLISEQDSLIRALKWLNKTTGTNNTSAVINRLNVLTKLPEILNSIATDTHWFDNSNNISDFKDRFKIKLSTPNNIKPDKEGYISCQSVFEISIHNPERDCWQVIYQKWINNFLRNYNINSTNRLKYSIVSDFKFRIEDVLHDLNNKQEYNIMKNKLNAIKIYSNQLSY